MAFLDLESSNPYTPAANTLLSPLQARFSEFSRDSSEKLYRQLSKTGKTAKVLRLLREDEFERLKQTQARHLAMLLSDELTHEVQLTEARKAGQVHALVGVDILWLIETYNYYQDELNAFLCTHIADTEKRSALMRILFQRILTDLEGQVESYRATDMELAKAFSAIDRHVMSAPNIADLVRGSMAVIGQLAGGVNVFFGRPDEAGELQIEQSYGQTAEQYHMAMEAGKTPKVSIDPDNPAGRGPGGSAWRSGEIVCMDAWYQASASAPWKAVGLELGFRSSAAIPLLDDAGRSIALLSLYSAWPGFFSTGRIRNFLGHVQQILSHAVQRRSSAPVIPLRKQQTYRRMLDERRVVMHYQPVIDLHDGRLTKVEALARMRTEDGEWILPERFLPALGREELLELFTQGLEQACAACLRLESEGIKTNISINFPVEGFDDTRYEEAVIKTLEASGLAASRLQLEVLETQEAGEFTEVRNRFIVRLKEKGIHIIQDDLGSGHSSLLRLEQYPFEEVKIDQGLVRGALRNPKRAVEFILYLTRLVHAFNIPVTVEGLENTGMIEVAAILGADQAQGYGIAEPMPIEQIAAWHKNFVYSIQPHKPMTALGAMAGYLLWDLQLAAIAEQPELAAQFVGAKSIVDHFIQANKLQGGAIDQLVRRNQELAATSSGETETAKDIRAQLLQELTDYWLREAG